MSYNKLPEYNGWTNKPTWLLNLWLTNEVMSYDYYVGLADEYLDEYKSEREAVHQLAEQLKDEVEYSEELGDVSLETDLLSWAKAYINYKEVAQHIVSTAIENYE